MLKLGGVEFDLGVGHVDGLERVCLSGQGFFLVLEVFDSVGQVRALDLLAAEMVYFTACLNHIFFAESDQR